MTYREIQEDVIRRYHVTINEKSECRRRIHAHIQGRMICKWQSKQSIHATFDLFHEIGHIETTTKWMRRAEAEYLATIWAMDRCREYGLTIPEKLWSRYDAYIKKELERGIRRGGANYPRMELPRDLIEKECV